MGETLTPAQREAVYNRNGDLLVSAAAGSGKTKVLVDRLLTYLTDAENPANVDEFLMITYTKAAASELRGKIAAKLTERIAEAPENRHLQRQLQQLYLTKISTVHGFCSDILKEYAYRLDIPVDFRVADEVECQQLRQTVLTDLLENAYAERGEDADFRAFVDTQGYGRDDGQLPTLIERVYDAAMCHEDAEGWLDSCLHHMDLAGITDAGQTLWGRYLVAQLQEQLAQEIQLMGGCTELLDRMGGAEKQADLFRNETLQLQNLRNLNSWDAIVTAGKPVYGRLSPLRKPADALVWAQVKQERSDSKKRMEKAFEVFTDDSQTVLAALGQSAAAQRGLIGLVRQFGAEYGRKKRTARVLDFSDLEHKMLELLLGKSRSGPTAAAKEIGSRFREIMVDEYQDSNRVQDTIFRALSGQRHNRFLVGDVKQSIYQFRLADPTIFLEKYNTWNDAAEAEKVPQQRVLLSHNFRSGGEVVEAVNAVFTKCMRKGLGGLDYTDAEALREGIPHEPLPGEGVELYCLEAEEDAYGTEAAFVAQRIAQLLAEGTPVRTQEGFRPVTAEDIVILLRSPNSVGGQYAEALERLGIPCTAGGGDNLLEADEIAFFRGLLQVISNPRQDIPLLAALAGPVFGFTADDLAIIRGKQKTGCVYDALVESGHPKAQRFLEMLAQLRTEARMGTLSGLLRRCFRLTEMESIYGALPGGSLRQKNLQDFYRLAAAYGADSLKTVEQFLEHLDALEAKGMANPAASAGVTVMSIHKSKGLEFPVVFLCGLSKRFNSDSLKAQILCHPSLGLGLSAADRKQRIRYPTIAKRAIMAQMQREMISEELRILYVAMTRPKDRLIMTYTSKSLTTTLERLAYRSLLDGGEAIGQEASCMGTWVLLTALGRTEAGELQRQSGVAVPAAVSAVPWRIRVVQPTLPTEETAEMPQEAGQNLPEGTAEQLAATLAFRYGHEAAASAPSKQTATGRKGRAKDEETAELTQQPDTAFVGREPSFVTASGSGKAYGNAMHAAMQFLRFSECGDERGVRQEVQRLRQEGFLSEEQAAMVNVRQLAAFFATDVGWRLRSGAEVLREFKFSLLDDGRKYGEGLEGEKVLLQGVVDCALLEPEGITLVDFKTDRVTPQTAAEKIEQYRPQLETYAEALERIFERRVTRKLLYFFRLGQLREL